MAARVLPEPLRPDEELFAEARAEASKHAECRLWQARCAELIGIVANLRAQLARKQMRVATHARRSA
jgi:hypothetical protein